MYKVITNVNNKEVETYISNKDAKRLWQMVSLKPFPKKKDFAIDFWHQKFVYLNNNYKKGGAKYE